MFDIAVTKADQPLVPSLFAAVRWGTSRRASAAHKVLQAVERGVAGGQEAQILQQGLGSPEEVGFLQVHMLSSCSARTEPFFILFYFL